MSYREIAPPQALESFVQCFWTYQGHGSGAVERIAPDGRCEIVLHLGQPYEEPNEAGGWRRQPRALFAGQLTRPLLLRNDGPVDVVCARFRHAGARPFTGAPLKSFTDRRTALAELWPAAEVEALFATDQTLSALTEALICRAEGAADPVVEAVIEGRSVELSLRQIERRFADQVGVPPRTLAAILRFRRTFDLLEHEADGQWARAAAASGYFDQPQMARDFKRFLGCSATAFVRERAGLAEPLSAARQP